MSERRVRYARRLLRPTRQAYQGIFRAVGAALPTDLARSFLWASGVGLYATVAGGGDAHREPGGWPAWQHVAPTATFLYGASLAVLGGILLAGLVPNRSTPSSGRPLV